MRTIAFAGLGIMGWPMGRNLARAGFALRVWTRTSAKAERFAREHSAVACPTPAVAAEGADAVVTMLPDGPEVESTLLGADGACQRLQAGALVVDCSTVAPSFSRALAAKLRERGIALVDAPVTGSRPKAEDGTLTFMVGGDERDVARARPLFDAMGELVVHVGPQGHGAFAKVIANTVTAINAAAVAEALAAVASAELDAERWLEAAAAGSSGSRMLDLKARPMLARDYAPLFRLRHMLKDVRHCLAEARALGVELELATVAERLYARAVAAGLGDRDFAAVHEVVARPMEEARSDT